MTVEYTWSMKYENAFASKRYSWHKTFIGYRLV